ncbi:hypothetical protein [Enterococcus italicus]|uniref:hypothetical protein n=1 Tax=Enterococcus italicus TaxID=246144 RepID=UPI003F4499AF
MAILSRGQITLVNMGDMMDLIDQHIAYAWSPDGKDRFTRNWSENLLRYSNKSIVQSTIGRTTYTPSYDDLATIFVNDGKGIVLEQGEKYTLSFKYNIANYNNPKLTSIGYGLGMSAYAGEYWIDTYATANSYETASGQITLTFTANNSGGKYPCLAMRALRWNEGVSFEWTETDAPYITITELSLVKSTGNDVYVTNPQDDYDNSTPRYIGRSLKDSNNPADYKYEPNPERKPWVSYAQGVNGEGLSFMPYGEQLQLGTNQPFTMGYGISNTAWKDGWAYLDTKPENTAFSNEILPQNGMFYNFVPENGKTYTQSIRIKTDAKYNPNNSADFTWYTSDGHNRQKASILPLNNNEYIIYSKYTWNKTGIALRAFDIFDLHTAFGFRDSTATYLAFKEPKLEPANTMGIPTPWTPAPTEDPLGAIPKYVGTAALPYEDPYKYEWDLNPSWLQQESNNNLANKVDNDTYNNDQSNVWTEISNRVTEEEAQAIQKSLDRITGAYTDFVSTGGKHDQDLANLKSAINTDIQKLADKVLGYDFVNTWFRIGDGGLSIGEANSNFELLISNDQITFYDSGTAVAYVSNQSFFINSGMIVDDLQIGKFKFAKVNDNLMGLFHIA